MTKFCPSKKVLQSKIYQTAKQICEVFHKHNIHAYMVGGCVRDFILFPKNIPTDIDIATSASVEQIQSLFPKSVYVGNSFGVCLIKLNHKSFEVATFRKDGPYLDRRHPSNVTQGTMEEDSRRRDFTINALYFCPVHKIIIDLYKGLVDLKKKQLQCVGAADDRIYEDALRILRCLRFSANFEFKIEKSLMAAVKKHQDGLKLIPKERILDELSKVCRFRNFAGLFYEFIDISLFFENLKKKQKKNVVMLKTFSRSKKEFVFSEKSMFFTVFLHLLSYYTINSVEKLYKEIKLFPCATYDKKLCLWYINLFQKYDDEFEFFKELVKIERLEEKPNPKIFNILKETLLNKSYVKIVNGYVRTKNDFSQKDMIADLQSKNIPQAEYSSIILRNRFNAL